MLQARDLLFTLIDLDEWLRSKIKHGTDIASSEGALEGCRAHLHELLAVRDISLHG